MPILAPNDPPGKAGSSRVRNPSEGWAEHAEALADWAWSRVVMRHDVYGGNGPDGKRVTVHEPLTRDVLIGHFQARRIIGAHPISTDNLCKWFAGDIDAHDDDQVDPERNWQSALVVARTLVSFGLKALILDSDGKCGYHDWTFLKKPVPCAVMHWLGEQVNARLKAEGFPEIETFPKQSGVNVVTPFGNWLRLPGKHHKRDHWTRVYDPETGRWFEGAGAALRLVKVAGDYPKALLKAYEEAQPAASEANGKVSPPGPARRHDHEDKPSETKVRDALAHIPNHDDHYDTWLGVGMALNDWDQSAGLPLWIEYSARSRKHDEATCRGKWSSFTPGGGLTVGSIFHEAKARGWKPTVERALTEGSKARRNGKARTVPDPAEEDPPADDSTDEELGLTLLSTVTPVELEWTWRDRIPRGKISLIAGEGGIGKTYMTLDWATIKSRGAVWPDRPEEPVPPGDVILVSAEDDLADTIVPRLKLMGANLDRIVALGTARMRNGILKPFTLADIARLEAIVKRRPETCMIVVDPVTAFLGSRINDNHNSELRALLGPLADFAARYRVAIVAVTHFSKRTDGKAAARVIGSVAYSNAARATWCVALDPENESRRLLMPIKNNLSRDRTSMAFTIDNDGRVVWEPKPLKLDVNTVLGAQSVKDEKLLSAVEWLESTLSTGSLASNEVKDMARRAGYGRDLIWKAKDRASVKAVKDGLGGWLWELSPAPVQGGENGRTVQDGSDASGRFRTLQDGSKHPEASVPSVPSRSVPNSPGEASCSQCLKLFTGAVCPHCGEPAA